MKKKILVIEDDTQLLRLMEYILQHKGYQVLLAQNGLEGAKRAQDERPDLIVLDIMLPGLDGYDVCQLIRQRAETSTVPVLMISGKSRPDDKEIGLKMGANAYLAKPIRPSTLAAEVDTLLASTNQTSSENTSVTG